MIFHLTTESAWEAAQQTGTVQPASLSTEGFIHFSTREQLLETAAIHFKQANKLVILEVEEKLLPSEDLKWEKSRNQILFPHLYRQLEVAEVSRTFFLERNGEGNWYWP